MGDARAGGTPKAPAGAAMPSPRAKMSPPAPRTRGARRVLYLGGGGHGGRPTRAMVGVVMECAREGRRLRSYARRLCSHMLSWGAATPQCKGKTRSTPLAATGCFPRGPTFRSYGAARATASSEEPGSCPGSPLTAFGRDRKGALPGTGRTRSLFCWAVANMKAIQPQSFWKSKDQRKMTSWELGGWD